MRAALEIAHRWAREGKGVAAATLVSIGGSVPRRAGARLLVSSGGDSWGSVSFGCVDADVTAHAAAVLESGQPGLAAYGVSDEDAFAVGFTCGGTMEVFIEPWTQLYEQLGGAPGERFLGAMVTLVSGPGTGTHGLVDADGLLVAGSVSPVSVRALATDVGAAVGDEQARLIDLRGTRVFVEPLVPPPRLIVFGAGHTAQALTAAAAAVGFRVTVSDHRPALAVPGRYPDAAEVLVGRPDEVVPTVAPDARAYVVCLAHNPEIEDLLLPLVLASDARYVGVLGSTRTHAARVERLVAAGVPEEQLARMHAPVGLDLGAVTPEEIAASIVAELIAVRRGG